MRVLNREHGVLLRVVIGAAVLSLTCVFLWWLVGPNTPEQKTAFIQTMGTIVGGSALLFGLYFTARNLQVSREGQITERYTHAIDQLGTDKLEVRLGGIYALERIARDSERDHWPIMEVLTTYVREHAVQRPGEGPQVRIGETFDASPERTGGPSPAPEPEIQAIMTVLGRRTRYFGEGEPEPLDLHLTNLAGANLEDANLREANLGGAYLRVARLLGAHLEGAYLLRANLDRAHLDRAHLEEAHLEQARLWYATLQGAFLQRAYLQRADLREANLQGANLHGANLQETHLYGASLEGADLREPLRIDGKYYGITQEQLEQAIGDKTTLLPDHLKRPAHWGVKIDDYLRVLEVAGVTEQQLTRFVHVRRSEDLPGREIHAAVMAIRFGAPIGAVLERLEERVRSGQ
jgi:uncharacterized protein YjbI with pentapeptide repeats